MKFPADEAEEDEARELAVRVVKSALNIPSQLEFGTLPTLEPIKQLNNTDPELYHLLDIFVGGDYHDYEEFKEEHEGWLESNGTFFTKSFISILVTLFYPTTLNTITCVVRTKIEKKTAK